MYSTAEFRNGLKVEMDGEPYIIVEFQHVKPGKGGAFVRTRLKNLRTGLVLDKTFKSGDKVGRPNMDERTMQFLYRDDRFFHFMDTTSYEQIQMTEEQMGDATRFLTENLEITVLFFNDEPIAIDLPNSVVLEIIEYR